MKLSAALFALATQLLLVHSEAGPIRGVSKRTLADDADQAAPSSNVHRQAQGAKGKAEGGPAALDICDDLIGAEYGLCVALCEASDCADDGFESCQPQLRQWQRVSGTAFPPCCGPKRRNLNEGDAVHRRSMEEIEGGVAISVEANHPDEYDWVKAHLGNMQGRLAEGKITRAWDPLFRAYFKHAEEVQTECVHSEDSFI